MKLSEIQLGVTRTCLKMSATCLCSHFLHSYHYFVCTSSVNAGRNVKGSFIFINVNRTIILYLQLIIFAADIQVLSDMSYWNLQATVNTSNLWNIPRILLEKHITCSSQADIRLLLTKMFQKLPTSGSKCLVCRKIKQNRNTLGRVWLSDLSELLRSVTMQLHYCFQSLQQWLHSEITLIKVWLNWS